jgi:hypothetical protein
MPGGTPKRSKDMKRHKCKGMSEEEKRACNEKKQRRRRRRRRL